MLMRRTISRALIKAKFEVTSEDMVKTNPYRTIYKALSEMEILNGIFSRGFLGINLSLLRLEFLAGFLPNVFLFYKMQFMNRLEFFCFADFWSFKTRVEYGFL